MTRVLVLALSFIFFILPDLTAQSDLKAPRSNMPESGDADSVYYSDSGYISIMWTEDEENQEAIYTLQQSESEDFSDAEVIYQGHDRASFLRNLL